MKNVGLLFALFALAACGQSNVDAAGNGGASVPASVTAPAKPDGGECCSEKAAPAGECCGDKAAGAKGQSGCCAGCSSESAPVSKPAGDKP